MILEDSASAQAHDYFLQEATELLQTMDNELQELAESFSVQKVHNLMRAAHTLKGAAASVGLDSIKETTHSIEDVFKALCHQDTVITAEMEELIFAAYDCLKLLLSVQFDGTQADEADITDRMTGIVAQLQEQLGDRFGQEGHLPTSDELGFDMTESIFEVGVMQRLDLFETALVEPDADAILALMQSQAEVFVGLAESLGLPGFAAIAQTIQTALAQNPDNVLEIAPVALANYRAAQADVLSGDRVLGGSPFPELVRLASLAINQPVIESPSSQLSAQKEISAQKKISAQKEIVLSDAYIEEIEIGTLEELTRTSLSLSEKLSENAELTNQSPGEEIEETIDYQPVDNQTVEPAINAVEDNWLLRLLKPPVCAVDREEKTSLALNNLVPDQLTSLNLSENTAETSFSEAVALLKSAEFEESELNELVPENLYEIDIPSKAVTSESQETERLEIATLADDSADEDTNHGPANVDWETTDWEPTDWLGIELPTTDFSVPSISPKQTDTPSSNELIDDFFNIEPLDIDLPNIETSDIDLQNVEIEVLDIKLSDIELPDANPSEANVSGIDLPTTIGCSVEDSKPLPDLSLVFNLDSESSDSKPSEKELEHAFQTALDRTNSHKALPKSRDNSSNSKETAPVISAYNKRKHSQATLRISVDRLDQLTQLIGKLLTQQNTQALHNEQLNLLVKQLLWTIDQQQKQLSQTQARALEQQYRNFHKHPQKDITTHFDSIEFDRYSDLQIFSQTIAETSIQQLESAESIELLARRTSQTLDKQRRLLANMRETLLEARMLPLDNIFQRFPAVIKRLEAQQQKQVKLVITGGDVLVDRIIADKLYDPILHLLRNAFDHGIEPTEQRLRHHKPAVGTITIEARQQGRHLVIDVIDDGQGLDLAKVRRKAVENKIIESDEAIELTTEQTTDLLFEPGFSTASEVSHLSGRGVGLDAVRAQVRSLQGQVTVSRQCSAGTCFTLQIPSSLTIAKLMLCESSGHTYALIADAIEHILIPSTEQVRAWQGGKAVIWKVNGAEYLVPTRALDQILQYASFSPVGKVSVSSRQAETTVNKPVILIRHNETFLGLEVDRLIGEQELAINALSETIRPPDYLYGSSILPDGQLTLVLDSTEIAKIALDRKEKKFQVPITTDSKSTFCETKSYQSTLHTHSYPDRQKIALTIDDSVTVRNSIAAALQEAGYQVLQARDGANGLQQLYKNSNIDIVLCDLEMPGMNGFEFLRICQRTPQLAKVPTIILTSRDSQKHRLLAKELGVIAYLTKPFLAPQLIKTIASAIETSYQRALV